MSTNAITPASSTIPSFRLTLFAIAAGFVLLAGLIAVPFANAHTSSARNVSITSMR
jgi:hypothetical protein